MMRVTAMGRLALVVCLGVSTACTGKSPSSPTSPSLSSPPSQTLAAFDEASWQAQLERWQAIVDKQRQRDAYLDSVSPPPQAPESKPFLSIAPAASIAESAAADTPAAAESITNVQTAGVDEGSIVKQHGRHLVVLRRGRLFTVDVGKGAPLRPVSQLNAFGPGIDPDGAWYDEMLVADHTVVVIGYSYMRDGTEVGLFDIDDNGQLTYRATYQLRSNDYYSARNYASRLIGQTLIFYSPMSLSPYQLKDGDFYPALRSWSTDALESKNPSPFQRILPATRIYRSDDELNPLTDTLTLHTVTRCDLSQRQMQCQSTAVLGPQGRVFYVSADSVFVWTTFSANTQTGAAPSSVFRIPLDGSAPSGLKTVGGPVDQLSFLHDADGYLNVLLTAQSDGDGMWSAETRTGDTALLRVALSSFGDGSTAARPQDYRPLPPIATNNPQNRYIGDWLIYNGNTPARKTGNTAPSRQPQVHAVRYASTAPAQSLPLAHDLERIEAMGKDGVLVGNAGRDLHFTSLRLERQAHLVNSFIQTDAAQGETRTHGFFYKPQQADQGMIGLPVMLQAPRGMQRYRQTSAGVVFLRNRALQLSGMGQLDAANTGEQDDDCQSSCVDWYGNARPLFIGDRVFALLGYELVEGEVDGDRIHESRRVDFSPRPRPSIAR